MSAVRSSSRSPTSGASGVLPASVVPANSSALQSSRSSNLRSAVTQSNALNTGFQHILLSACIQSIF